MDEYGFTDRDYADLEREVAAMPDEDFWVFYAAAAEESPRMFAIYVEDAQRRREPVY